MNAPVMWPRPVARTAPLTIASDGAIRLDALCAARALGLLSHAIDAEPDGYADLAIDETLGFLARIARDPGRRIVALASARERGGLAALKRSGHGGAGVRRVGWPTGEGAALAGRRAAIAGAIELAYGVGWRHSVTLVPIEIRPDTTPPPYRGDVPTTDERAALGSGTIDWTLVRGCGGVRALRALGLRLDVELGHGRSMPSAGGPLVISASARALRRPEVVVRALATARHVQEIARRSPSDVRSALARAVGVSEEELMDVHGAALADELEATLDETRVSAFLRHTDRLARFDLTPPVDAVSLIAPELLFRSSQQRRVAAAAE